LCTPPMPHPPCSTRVFTGGFLQRAELIDR
jgi:hypothetical protein